MYLNIVCKTEGTGLKSTNSSVAVNSVVSHWALLNDLPQIEEFQRASKINNHLNPKTGYFNKGEYFHFAKTIPIQGKKNPQHFCAHRKLDYTQGYYFLFQFTCNLNIQYSCLMN